MRVRGACLFSLVVSVGAGEVRSHRLEGRKRSEEAERSLFVKASGLLRLRQFVEDAEGEPLEFLAGMRVETPTSIPFGIVISRFASSPTCSHVL